jgi:hypothetical protein
MKKILLSITALLMLATFSSAQSSSAAFSPSDNLLNVGIGLGTPFFGSGYSSSIPINPTISYEKGVIDNLSIGGEFSYASSKYSFDDGFGDNYSITYNAIYVGARASYHFGGLLSLPSKFDVYGGATAGYIILSVSDNAGDSSAQGSTAGGGGFVGGKFYFSSKTAVYAELGYQSLSYINVGIAFKL